MGHFFRTLEITRALEDHQVHLLLGGMPVGVEIPGHLEVSELPEVRMDEEFSSLFAMDSRDMEDVWEERRAILERAFSGQPYDVFLVELYPFGRKAFRVELDPLLERLREEGATRVACSLRDILVEKRDREKYETRVIETLRKYFDAVLVHADPGLVRLPETFSRARDIPVPLAYTGFVTPKPGPGSRERTRRWYGLGKKDRLVVASAGGGKVGFDLLENAVLAMPLLRKRVKRARMHVYTGPYMDQEKYERLKGMEDRHVRVQRFNSDFLSELAAADLSVSMAGYNTTMNILAAGVPALVLPFARNREQGMRASRLRERCAVDVLVQDDLAQDRMAARMLETMGREMPETCPVDIEGARNTARWLEVWMKTRRPR
ncbi:MAG: glycosyltransferase family protein [Desulfatibacillaceae bacterium]